MHAQSAPDIRNAPIAFWRIAESFLNVLYCLFGAPEEVAFKHTLTRKDHDLLTSWLRAGEAMLRRLLMIEAAAFKEAVARARGAQLRQLGDPSAHACVSPPAGARRAVYVSPDDPGAWRVSFRCILDRRRPRRRIARNPAKEVRFRSAWPLARRYEAMIRVFNDPHAYAKRLACRLRAKPSLVAIVLRAPPEYGHRVDRADDLTDVAARAWPPPDSS